MQFLLVIAAVGAVGTLLGIVTNIPSVTSGVTGAISGIDSLVCSVSWIIPVDTLFSCVSLIVGVYSLGLLIRVARWLLDLLPLGGGF